jgi:hypothetical protein
MPRDGAGNYTLPVNSVDPAVTNTTINPTDFNSTMNDLAAEITDSVDRSGKGAMLANLGMGGFKITNLGAATTNSDAVRRDTSLVGDVTGTINSNNVTGINGTAITGVTGTGNAVLSIDPNITGGSGGAFQGAGFIGEVITATAGPTSIVTSTDKTIASITLTAGNWLVFGGAQFSPAGSTTTTYALAGISTTNNSIASPLNAGTKTISGSRAAGVASWCSGGIAVQSISGSVIYYLVAQSQFAVSTMTSTAVITGVRLP